MSSFERVNVFEGAVDVINFINDLLPSYFAVVF